MNIELRMTTIDTFSVFTAGKKCTRKNQKNCGAFVPSFHPSYAQDECRLFNCIIHGEQRADICKEYFKNNLAIENGVHKVFRTIKD